MHDFIRARGTALLLCVLLALAAGSASAIDYTYPSPKGSCSSISVGTTGEIKCNFATLPEAKLFFTSSSTVCSAGLTVKLTGEFECAKILPICTLSPSSAMVAPGGTVTLTSNCSPAATQYVWTGDGLPSLQTSTNINTATLPPTKEGYYTYSVLASNDAGAGSNAKAVVKAAIPNQAVNYAYVPSQVDSRPSSPGVVWVIDPATNNLKATINVGVYPTGVAVNSAGTLVYVTNYGNNTVSVIDTATNKVISGIIDPSDNQSRDFITVGAQPFGVAVAPDGRKAYVANEGDGTVMVIDTATNKVIKKVKVGVKPQGVAVSPNGTRVYIANNGSKEVSVINTSDYTIVGSVPTDNGPYGVAVTPDSNKVYVTNSLDNTIQMIDAAKMTPFTSIVGGSKPQGIAINPAGTLAYVVNNDSGTVLVIDIDARNAATYNTVLHKVDNVGNMPVGVVFHPAGYEAYVVNSGDGTMTTIDSTANTVFGTHLTVGGNPYALGQFIRPALVPPQCTLTASSPAIAPGSSATLSVSCSPAATSYSWSTNTGFASTVTTGTVSPPVTTDFTVTGNNASGAAGNSASVTVTVTAPVTPPVCTLSATPPSISAGGTYTLTASCNPAATSYVWTGGTCAGATGASCTVTPSATATNYTVMGSNTAGTGTPSSPFTEPVTVSTSSSYTGLWWNPNESGWGMSVTQHGSMIFAVPYTYDATGQPTWYVMSSCPIVTAGSCTGDLDKVTGGTSPVVPWTGAIKVEIPAAGTGTLSFDDANHGRFSYTLNGVSSFKVIERQLFSNGTPQFGVDYTDLWWNANESGWGISLTQDHGMIFAAWYTYDAGGKAIWLVASDCPLASASAGNGCTGPLYQFSGGTPLTTAWNFANKAYTQVGSVTFTFSDANNGLMTYTLNGVADKRIITRQGF